VNQERKGSLLAVGRGKKKKGVLGKGKGKQRFWLNAPTLLDVERLSRVFGKGHDEEAPKKTVIRCATEITSLVRTGNVFHRQKKTSPSLNDEGRLSACYCPPLEGGVGRKTSPNLSCEKETGTWLGSGEEDIISRFLSSSGEKKGGASFCSDKEMKEDLKGKKKRAGLTG